LNNTVPSYPPCNRIAAAPRRLFTSASNHRHHQHDRKALLRSFSSSPVLCTLQLAFEMTAQRRCPRCKRVRDCRADLGWMAPRTNVAGLFPGQSSRLMSAIPCRTIHSERQFSSGTLSPLKCRHLDLARFLRLRDIGSDVTRIQIDLEDRKPFAIHRSSRRS
jgi:hypothetical protein